MLNKVIAFLKRMTVVVALGALVGTGLVVATPLGGITASYANDADGFERGNIITDANFYNGGAMSAKRVQQFLEEQVPRCTLGDEGRKKGSPYFNTKLAQNCLIDFKMNTKSRKADKFCKAYKGKKNETAAEIIVNVGKACDVSPKVLLVNLQKEMSFITDSWPTEFMFDRAMGYSCPDSGPGVTPECDAEYAGFYNQMYWGARQIQRYKSDDYFSWLPIGKSTYRQYAVDPQCGGRNVRIQNHATAALYYYTPYTPHNNLLQGKSYNCSRGSDANINFYKIYKNWFGQPNWPYTVANKFSAYADSRRTTWLGMPSADAVTYKGNNGGMYQHFAGGSIFAGSGQKTYGMKNTNSMYRAYRDAGFVDSDWGWPASALKSLGSGNAAMEFTKTGVVISNKRTYKLPSLMYAAWVDSGYMSGDYGAPTGNAKTYKSNTQQKFKKGTVVVNSKGKARIVSSSFVSAWNKDGGVRNPAGIPNANAKNVKATKANGNVKGKTQRLTKGEMYSSKYGKYTIQKGDLLTRYNKAKGPSGKWGWPAAELNSYKNDIQRQKFSKGWVLAQNGRAQFVSKKMYKVWRDLGGLNSQYGVPIRNEVTYKGQTHQKYTSATIVVNKKGKARVVSSSFASAWLKEGGVKNPAGIPNQNSKNIKANKSKKIVKGKTQRLTNGEMYRSEFGKYTIAKSDLLTKYKKANGPQGRWGWPAGELKTFANGLQRQKFSRGWSTLR